MRPVQDDVRDPYAAPHRTEGEERARAAAARVRLVLDRKRGRETEPWIRALAQKFARP